MGLGAVWPIARVGNLRQSCCLLSIPASGACLSSKSQPTVFLPWDTPIVSAISLALISHMSHCIIINLLLVNSHFPLLRHLLLLHRSLMCISPCSPEHPVCSAVAPFSVVCNPSRRTAPGAHGTSEGLDSGQVSLSCHCYRTVRQERQGFLQGHSPSCQTTPPSVYHILCIDLQLDFQLKQI